MGLILYCILHIILLDAINITAALMKYMRRTARYTWTDYKTNAQFAKELKITTILEKLLEYKKAGYNM